MLELVHDKQELEHKQGLGHRLELVGGKGLAHDKLEQLVCKLGLVHDILGLVHDMLELVHDTQGQLEHKLGLAHDKLELLVCKLGQEQHKELVNMLPLELENIVGLSFV